MNNKLQIIPKLPKGDKHIPLEWVKLLFDRIDNVRDRTYLIYHIETGLRVSDVVNTEIVHIDWHELRTYTYDHKKDEWRYIYFPLKVKSVLKIWLQYRQNEGIKDKRLFPFTDKTANRIIKKWAKVIKFHYADKISSHWCRHTFIKLSRKAGRDIKAVQQNTGDTIGTLLNWYSDLNAEEMRDEIDNKPITE